MKKGSTATKKAPAPVEFDDYDEGYQEPQGPEETDLSDPKYYEEGMIQTVKEFTKYVASITKDLETQEKEYLDELKAQKKPVPKSLWADSTFKINFVGEILLNLFKDRIDRLMKYYVIFLIPLKPWIVGKEEKFFLKANIFPGAPEEDIKFFRNLWSIEGTMTTKEKDDIWEFLQTMLEITEDWQDLTKWVVNPKENLNIPNIDYAGEARRLGLPVPNIGKQ